MFQLRRPSESEINDFLKRSIGLSFSYSQIGFTETGGSEGFILDHNRVRIGKGDADFDLAIEAVRAWKMFDFPWVELCWPDTPIQKGRTVAIVVNHFGFWSMSAARIVYVIDKPARFGFAYGTLAEHVESGEERFSVEIDQSTGDVWYDLFALSKPNHALAKLGYPISRMLQKRFARDSLAAMKRAVQRANIP